MDWLHVHRSLVTSTVRWPSCSSACTGRTPGRCVGCRRASRPVGVRDSGIALGNDLTPTHLVQGCERFLFLEGLAAHSRRPRPPLPGTSYMFTLDSDACQLTATARRNLPRSRLARLPPGSFYVGPGEGLEPSTYGLTVRCGPKSHCRRHTGIARLAVARIGLVLSSHLDVWWRSALPCGQNVVSLQGASREQYVHSGGGI